LVSWGKYNSLKTSFLILSTNVPPKLFEGKQEHALKLREEVFGKAQAQGSTVEGTYRSNNRLIIAFCSSKNQKVTKIVDVVQPPDKDSVATARVYEGDENNPVKWDVWSRDDKADGSVVDGLKELNVHKMLAGAMPSLVLMKHEFVLIDVSYSRTTITNHYYESWIHHFFGLQAKNANGRYPRVILSVELSCQVMSPGGTEFIRDFFIPGIVDHQASGYWDAVEVIDTGVVGSFLNKRPDEEKFIPIPGITAKTTLAYAPYALFYHTILMLRFYKDNKEKLIDAGQFDVEAASQSSARTRETGKSVGTSRSQVSRNSALSKASSSSSISTAPSPWASTGLPTIQAFLKRLMFLSKGIEDLFLAANHATMRRRGNLFLDICDQLIKKDADYQIDVASWKDTLLPAHLIYTLPDSKKSGAAKVMKIWRVVKFVIGELSGAPEIAGGIQEDEQQGYVKPEETSSN